MKIEYDLRKCKFKYHDFIQGVSLKRNKLKKKTKIKSISYTKTIINLLIGTILFFGLGLLIYYFTYNLKVLEIFTFIAVYLIIFLLFLYLVFLILYIINRKILGTGTIIIDEEGITDSSKDISVKVNWDKVYSIIIKNNIAVVLLDNRFWMITFEIPNKKKFIDSVKKCNKKLLIIEMDK